MLTALIPAFNDAYTLSLCLESVAPHFEEIIVLDDASVDETPEVLRRAADAWPHIETLTHAGIPLGPIEARNRLLQSAQGDHLFFLDADDVLNEYNARLLHEIPDLAPMVGLQLAELWGDFDHTTQRLAHYDPCHIYLNRNLLDDILWGGYGGLLQRPSFTVRSGWRGPITVRGPGPLFWHIRGVKPDWRLLGRPRVHQWLGAGRPSYYYDEVLVRGLDHNHRLAMDYLLTPMDDHKFRPYEGSPRRPAVIEAARPRFELVYRNGVPVDRVDHGWWAGRRAQPLVSRHFAATRRPLQASAFTMHRVDSESVELGCGGSRLRLDNLAGAIWSLCNGKMTIEEIADCFVSAYPNQAECEVREAVVEAVLMLHWRDAVQFPGG